MLQQKSSLLPTTRSARVFGYHEIFHALVIAAAVCHFVAVTMALMRYAS